MAHVYFSKILDVPADSAWSIVRDFGGLGKGRSIDFLARLSFDLLGLKHKYVLGYQGQPEIALALQRKEIDASITGHTGYVTQYRYASKCSHEYGDLLKTNRFAVRISRKWPKLAPGPL